MEERRRIVRWQISKEAELTVADGVRAIPCVVEDINSRGCRVSLAKDLFPEAFSNFNLALSDDFAFNADAHVAWSDKAYERNIYGLSFSRIEESAKDKICQYVKDNFSHEIVNQWWRGT